MNDIIYWSTRRNVYFFFAFNLFLVTKNLRKEYKNERIFFPFSSFNVSVKLLKISKFLFENIYQHKYIRLNVDKMFKIYLIILGPSYIQVEQRRIIFICTFFFFFLSFLMLYTHIILLVLNVSLLKRMQMYENQLSKCLIQC